MIREIKSSEEDNLKKIIYKKRFINPYIYIDVYNDGFNSKNVKTYVIENNNEIHVILYDYYNSIQLLRLSRLSNDILKEMVDFIIKNKYKRISGDKKTIKQLHTYLKEYKCSFEITMICKNLKLFNSNDVKKAKKEDIEKIVNFLMECSQWNLSYTHENLTRQMLDRLNNYNCNMYYIDNNNDICSVFGEYGKFDKLVVLGGLYTSQEYRNKGYGSSLVKYILSENLKDGIMPIIYIVDKRLIKWYKHYGFKKLYKVGKLELILK